MIVTFNNLYIYCKFCNVLLDKSSILHVNIQMCNKLIGTAVAQ